MEYLLLFIVIFSVYVQHILVKQYNTKVKDENSNITFIFAKVLTATVFLGIIFLFSPIFSWTTFFFSLAFASSFAICSYSSFMAIKTGPLSLTTLISSFAIILPSLYSVIFLGESFTRLSIIGLILLFISFVLINKIEKDKKINIKWLCFALLCFFTNGINSILQKVHQENLKANGLVPNDYAVAFQFFAMIAVSAIFGVVLLVKRPKNTGKAFKRTFVYAPPAGVANAICNVLMLVLATMLSGVVLYPSVSAGGIVFTFVTALLFYKERYTKWQYVGYAFGIISIILLSL